MANFVYDDTELYGVKTNRSDPTNESQQWTADNCNLVRTALADIRTVLLDGFVNVKQFGATGDGITDDTAEIQAAINASEGRVLYFPTGKYVVSTTLFVTARSFYLLGDFSNRNAQDGTEIAYSGTGPCIQIGTDSGNPWNSNEYDGLQDHLIENIWIRHSAPDTNLVSSGMVGNHFKAGAYGIWDWRGGGIVTRNLGLEGFEANFVGVQSDINNWLNPRSNFSKYGLYVGPRSDQFTIIGLYSTFCDRAVTVDGATDVRIISAQIVGCGLATTGGIEIRQGSSAVRIDKCWLEHLQGDPGTAQLALVSVGEVAGYGAGGSIQSPGGTPNTNPVEGCQITQPFVFTVTAGNPTHTRYIASVNKCHRFLLTDPSVKVGNSLTNFDALVGVQAANAPTNAETQIEIRGVSSGVALADLFENLGAGAPDLTLYTNGPSGNKLYTSQRFSINTPGAAAGADEIRFSQESQVGEFWVITPQKPTGQTERLRLVRHMGTFTNAAAPSTGTYEQGDWKRISDPPPGGYMAWVCSVAGTPGTWTKAGLILKAVGYEVPDPFIATKQVRFTNELVTTTLAADQNDWNNGNATTFADAYMIVISASTTGINITGIDRGTNFAGRKIELYNTGANTITLDHESASSTANNRIVGLGGTNVSILANGCAKLYYSASANRWRVTSVGPL